MKDIVTPVPQEEVKGVIRKCLEQAAQLNYQRIQEYAKIEGNQKHTTSRNDCWSESYWSLKCQRMQCTHFVLFYSEMCVK